MNRKLILFCLGFLIACQTDPEPIEEIGSSTSKQGDRLESRANLNINILIDLSDRIDPKKYPNPTMEYFQRDTGYIASVVSAFNEHVISKKLILINDRIQTFIDPVPQDPDIVKNLQSLKVELNRDNVSKEILISLPADYKDNMAMLYKQAIEDNKYVGSDTWRFFKSSAKDYCIREDAQNVLIVLTDGYMFHTNNSKIIEGGRRANIGKDSFTELGLNTPEWKSRMEAKDLGFYAPDVHLSGLKVLVIGLNPTTKNPFEEDVLKAYWQKWFLEMGVKENDILIKDADLPVNLDESIQRFILNQ